MDQVVAQPAIREQLVNRRQRLLEVARIGPADDVGRLLREVDEALTRLQDGSYGLCETCRDPIEPERLIADPLVRFCLDHLTDRERRALEHDLDLAAHMQRALLPAVDVQVDGWEIAYHYAPAGVVSGDYCDHVTTRTGELYFMIGDVSGKGVAASMLMAHLHATLRTLVFMGLPLDELMARASRLFCESALPAHYATLVCGRATPEGHVEICNAGHPPPLVIRPSQTDRVDATGVPIGMFHDEAFAVTRLHLSPADTLLLYTDGVLEAEDASGTEYGRDRLALVVDASRTLPTSALVSACVAELAAFTSGMRPADDVTVMAIRRAADPS